ncbi:MAG: uracil-DNA glycosylase family protein, partial [Flammeovirgaceae bacterium]
TTAHLSATFYKKFYADAKSRYVILGINPGRLGSGITGVPFTDPINLEKYCGIKNNLPKKHELSSEFVYKVITAFGGLEKFYSRFYFTSVCPLGFTKDGKNINYYDDKHLQEKAEPFIIESLSHQLGWGLNKTKAFVFGEGKNFEYFQQLNQQHGFFKSLTPLPHPRFVMQYKLKKIDEYIDLYLRAFSVS